MTSASLFKTGGSRTLLSVCAVSALVLAGCADGNGGDGSAADAPEGSTVEFEDNNGTQTVTQPVESVVAVDNRTFETLSDWGIDLSAAAVSLMPDTNDYVNDESIDDIGNHREPDLETIVAADPDVVVSGQRFSQYNDEISDLVPDATVVDLEPREGEPFDEELRRQISTLGKIFDREEEAEELIGEFDASIERVNAAYNGEDTVMALNTSGGDIGYLAPTVGRTLGPVFDIFDLNPALQVDDASDDHQGDDISVEAIADSDPDMMMVMDRDAAVEADDPGYEPAADVLENSEALTGVSAVQNDRIHYMPADTYTNEGIQTYTEFFNDLADALEAQGD